MKRSWFNSFLNRSSHKREANVEGELAQILQELEQMSTSSDPDAQNVTISKVKDFLERHPERVFEIQEVIDHQKDELHLQREKLFLDDSKKIDLSYRAQDLRKQMGWPLTGSVRELEGASPEIIFAIEEIEKHGGKLTLRDASRVIAVLDPESPEADYFRWEAKKQKE